MGISYPTLNIPEKKPFEYAYGLSPDAIQSILSQAGQKKATGGYVPDSFINSLVSEPIKAAIANKGQARSLALQERGQDVSEAVAKFNAGLGVSQLQLEEALRDEQNKINQEQFNKNLALNYEQLSQADAQFGRQADLQEAGFDWTKQIEQMRLNEQLRQFNETLAAQKAEQESLDSYRKGQLGIATSELGLKDKQLSQEWDKFLGTLGLGMGELGLKQESLDTSKEQWGKEFGLRESESERSGSQWERQFERSGEQWQKSFDESQSQFSAQQLLQMALMDQEDQQKLWSAIGASPFYAQGVANLFGTNLGNIFGGASGSNDDFGFGGGDFFSSLLGTGTNLLSGNWAGAAWDALSLADPLVEGIGDIFGGCIIVTTATDPHSPEVEITREYRDTFLDEETLRGYYMIAEKVVPLMKKDGGFKARVKSRLVDPLIEYGKWMLGKTATVSERAKEVTEGFLDLCREVGERADTFTRANGEVV